MASDRSGDEAARDDAFSDAAEQWESWETRLVAVSLVLGVVGLVLLGWLVDRFILP